jgi:hypothetical protein
MTVKPSLISFSTTSGTVATRFSPAAVSLGTPIVSGIQSSMIRLSPSVPQDRSASCVTGLPIMLLMQTVGLTFSAQVPATDAWSSCPGASQAPIGVGIAAYHKRKRDFTLCISHALAITIGDQFRHRCLLFL